jgi:DNA helicase II / ATP-dependent DNA helicase PcrA
MASEPIGKGDRTYTLRPTAAEPIRNDIFRIPYAQELNAGQLEAVCTLEGPVLCLAGAGSGKTRALVYRTARLIEAGVAPDSILLLTFTRKSAQNMLGRTVALVGAAGQRVAGGTYHSFAHQILRQYGRVIGLSPAFSILDEADTTDLLNLLRTEMRSGQADEPSDGAPPPTAPTSGAEEDLQTTRFPLKKTISQMITRAANRDLPLEEIIAAEFPQFVEHAEALRRLHEAFTAYKREHHLVDYDDLLLLLERLLRDHPETRATLGRRYRYVMVDEYQDTNRPQARITTLLGHEHGNVMVVGDDAQSIYSFRGACVQNMLEFPTVFPGCRVIRLEENFRSTPEILTAANTLMTHAASGYPKTLFTRRPAGEKPALVPCGDEAEQAQFIAQRILDLRETGVPLHRMAVLFRSGFHAFQLEIELKRRNIPFVKWGGFKFLEAAHIKDLLAHLRIVQNPLDRVSWQRVLLLLDGIGPRFVAKFFAALANQPDPLQLPAFEGGKRAREGLNRLRSLLGPLAGHADEPPTRLLERITDYYLPIVKQRFDDWPKRLRDIDQFVLLAGRFDRLQDLLADMALEPPAKARGEALSIAEEDDEQLILSTVHSAKGSSGIRFSSSGPSRAVFRPFRA